MKREVDALIIFPTLGAPQILPANPSECTIIIATDDTGRESLLDPKRAAVLVNHHLRLIEFDDDKTELPLPIDHRFYGQIEDSLFDTNEQKLIDAARDYIAVDELELKEGVLTQQGKIIGRLSTDAYSLYTRELYTTFMSITLKQLSSSKYKLNTTPQSWAWIVRTNFGKTHKFLNPDKTKVDPDTQKQTNVPEECRDKDAKITTVHQPLDRLIRNELTRLAQIAPSEGGMMDDADLYEVPVETGGYGAPDKDTGYRRVQAWHPVLTQFPAAPFTLGHLTDTHISVRTATLAKSPVKIMEGSDATGRPFEPVGKRLAHTLKSFKALVDEMAAKKVSALAITGDAIDFNCNLDPQHTEGMTEIGQIWGILNPIANVRAKGGTYRRGIDQLYFYSMLTYAARELKLPAYYIAGNHEGYQWPFGISPRLDADHKFSAAWGSMTGGGSHYAGKLKYHTDKDNKAWEKVTEAKDALATAEMDLVLAKRADDAKLIKKAEAAKKEAEDDLKTATAKYESFSNSLATYHEKAKEDASKYHQMKATECIPSDHNLTIYEACLAFGPTYGQLLSTDSYRRSQCDWIHWLYAPFSDLNVYPRCTSLVGEGATHVLSLLGWGGSERIIPDVFFVVTGNKQGADRRGRGFLPYAKDSISDTQLAMLGAASELKASKWAVLSHFVVANYQDHVPATATLSKTGFKPSDSVVTNPFVTDDTHAQYNLFNWGGCELGLKTYLEKYTSMKGTPVAGQVNLHISGHSHRSGIYALQKASDCNGGVQVTCGVPKFSETYIPTAGFGTRYIVGSTAGPMGKQAMSGWDPDKRSWTDNRPLGIRLDVYGEVDNSFGEYSWNSLLGGWLTRPPSGLVIHLDSPRNPDYITAEGHEARNDKPRLAVMLDYREVASLMENAYILRPIIFVPTGSKTALDNGIKIYFSREAIELNCMKLNEMKVWVYKGGPEQQAPEDDSKNSSIATPSSSGNGEWLVSGANLAKGGMLNLADVGMIRGALTQKVDEKGKPVKNEQVALCAFMEIPLREPNRPGIPWDEVVCDESWVFPIEIGVKKGKEYLYRGERASGEVPNWDFLKEHCGYPKSESIIKLEGLDQPAPKKS
ncbi:MAG: metallophosphoesterase [Betaproteobacteria bacterium]|nr:metallophosphoesterase [Betaproteobacteria bacterium]